MNKFVGLGLAAAAVVVALVVGVQLLSSPGANIGGPGDEPAPTPTAEPTPEPTPSPSAEGSVPEGPFLILDGRDDGGEYLHPPLTVTIPAPGWVGDGEGGGILLKEWGQADGAGMIIFARPEYHVFGDPCNWATTMPDTPVATVDEFVAALSSQPTRNASEPIDITIGGYTGKSITHHIPDDADLSQCDEGIYGSWNCGEPADPPFACGFHGGPGETSTEYILDVDGVIMAWHTGYEAGAPADVVAELEAIVQSATFGE